MLTDSIRWRLQIWLAILLVGLLVGFGATAWQLEKTQRIRRLDDELAKRAVALGVAIRGGDLPPMFGRMFRGPGPLGTIPSTPLSPLILPSPMGRGGPEDTNLGDLFSGPGPRGDRPRKPRGGRPNDDGSRKGPPPEDQGPPDDRSRKPRGGPPDDDGSRKGLPPELRENRIPDSVKAMFPAEGPEGYYYSVWVGMSGRQQRSDNAPLDLPMPAPTGRDTQTRFRDRDGMREAYHFTERGECVLAGRPVGSDLAGMKPFAVRLSLTGLGVLALGLGGGWLLTTRSIRPIEQISASARRISEGNLSERIPVEKSGSELGQLATVLNTTFSRLEESFSQQKRFTADASHELRTPLTVLIAETQMTLSRERPAQEYRDALEGNLETARQMKRLAEALLELARLDAGGEEIAGMPFDLAEIAGTMLTQLKPLADGRSVTLSGTLGEAKTSGSPERLGQVISNLIENAIHHGKPGGSVIVSTWQTQEHACVSVADDGPGISPADLPHLFERFYRADKSRTGSRGRYGLGLAICRGMVEAEGGSISVVSQPREGAVFTVMLPR